MRTGLAGYGTRVFALALNAHIEQPTTNTQRSHITFSARGALLLKTRGQV